MNRKFITLGFLILLTLCNTPLSIYSQLQITEILASNANTCFDPDYSAACDWIEIKNTSSQSINLKGCFLTDDETNTDKWEIKDELIVFPGSYYIFWADGQNSATHTNFKLSSDGEYVGIFSPEQEVIDGFSFPKQYTDISYGRKSNSDEWVYFAHATPEKPNISISTSKPIFSAPAMFSSSGGVYEQTIKLEIKTESPHAKIYYTTDCSNPNQASSIYKSPINISTTTIVKSIAIEPNKLPSKVVVASYIFDTETPLPIVSISTNENNLWNDQIGIHCVGSNGITGYGINANYWQKWERPASFEYFDKDKKSCLNQEVGIAISGARRNMPQKSLRVYARGKYGAKQLSYPFFIDKPYTDHSSILLRNAGLPDFESSLIRDGVVHKLPQNSYDIDYQGHSACIVYLNGIYWGIYNIRERQNQDYLQASHQIHPTKVDLMEDIGLSIEGDQLHYNRLIKYLETADLSSPESYPFLATQLDVEEYLRYQITEIYCANFDWPGRNIKYWRPKTPRGKWRWMMFDVDAGFGLWGKYDHNYMVHATESNGPNWPNPPNTTFVFRKLLENATFRHKFITQATAMVSSYFATERVVKIIDSLKTNIATEVPTHIERWKQYDSSDGKCVQSFSDWESNIEVLKEFAEHRPSFFIQHIKEFFKLEEPVDLQINHNAHGRIEVEGVKIEPGQTGRYFPGLTLQLKANPAPGYSIKNWGGLSKEGVLEIEYTPKENLLIEIEFIRTKSMEIPGRIIGPFVLKKSKHPYIATGTIEISPSGSLTVEAGVKIEMNDGSKIINKGELILKGKENKPIKFYSSQSGSTHWGGIVVDSTSHPCLLEHVIISDVKAEKAVITAYHSKIALFGVDIRNSSNPFYSEYGEVSIKNSRFQTLNSGDLINIKYANSAIVDNCDLRGNQSFDSDAIDYDNLSNGIISNNLIYGFYGLNSDGIDIGEGALEVHVFNNRIINCFDKGISIGQASSAKTYNNAFVNCDLGVGVKDSLSKVEISNCTFFKNRIGVACFEKHIGKGGGEASIDACLFAFSQESDYFADAHSTIDIRNSSSTNNNSENRLDPFDASKFESPEWFNYSTTNDPIKKLIGCNLQRQALQPHTNKTKGIVINEIFYNPTKEESTGDWIEILNSNKEIIDLSGWVFCDEKDFHQYVFPEGLMLEPGEAIVLSNNVAPLLKNTTEPVILYDQINFSFSNKGETLRLFDATMNAIDVVHYSDSKPWPENADGKGYSLQRKKTNSNSNKPKSWQSSKVKGGSPGR